MGPAVIKLQSNIIVMKSVSGETLNVTKMINNVQKNGISTKKTSETKGNSETIFNLTFKDVKFKYNSDGPYVLNKLSLEVNPGEIAFVVGPSGSGKTTLIDLSVGLLSPVSGTVCIGSKPPQIMISQNPGKFAYVPQDPMIIAGTIRENLLLGSLDFSSTNNHLLQIIEQVGLGTFIRSLDQGIDTQVGEFGVALSGGQKQRLGLARALVSNPSFLFLDEVTSALDLESENAIKDLIESFKGNKTVVVVSHSKNLREVADKTFYLD